MIQRRTLIFAAPIALLSACSKAEAVTTASDLGTLTSPAIKTLAPTADEIIWLRLTGTVRTSENIADVRPAILNRALVRREVAAGRAETKFFDIWQSAGQPALAAPSATRQLRSLQDGTNGIWLEREFTHPALPKGVESSRMARSGAHVMALNGESIYLVSGGLSAAPDLSPDQAARLKSWLASLGLKTP